MFWRFSVPTTTSRRPDGSAIDPHGRSATFVYRSPHWAASRLMRSTSSAAAWSSAVDGGEEMDVGVGGDPPAGVEVDRPVQRQLEAPGRRVDLERARYGVRSNPPTTSTSTPPTGSSIVEPARHVGVRGRSEDEVAARVLEVARVDLVAMADRREVASVGRREADPAGTGSPLAPSTISTSTGTRGAGRSSIDSRSAGSAVGHPRGGRARHGPVVQAQLGVGRDRQVDDARPSPDRRPGRLAACPSRRSGPSRPARRPAAPAGPGSPCRGRPRAAGRRDPRPGPGTAAAGPAGCRSPGTA